MTENMYSRTKMLLGAENMERLKNAHVAVFGVGGVGGHCIEALARAGLGRLTIVDRDVVSESNLNRQIIALRSTIGRPKVEVMRERLEDINPEMKVTARNMFFLPENSGDFVFTDYDYVVDAVDTVTAKIEIIRLAKAEGVPVISSMGTGNKLHPECFRIDDISRTDICPLARVMRKELKKRGIEGVKCLYSTEKPLTSDRPPATVSFVPSAGGLLIAGEVIRDLCCL